MLREIFNLRLKVYSICMIWNLRIAQRSAPPSPRWSISPAPRGSRTFNLRSVTLWALDARGGHEARAREIRTEIDRGRGDGSNWRKVRTFAASIAFENLFV